MVDGDDAFGFVGMSIEPQVRVEARVGEGGFSVVYRARHLGLNEDVAVKCMKLPGGLQPALVDQLVERFRAESRITYRLSQGNLDIVRSISSGATVAKTGATVPYIVLEWLAGHSLMEDFRVRRSTGNAARSLDEVVQLFEPAALALEYAHKQGVVHRDVKPGNLFLASTRAGVRLKVLDFGLAKLVDPDGLGIVPGSPTLARAQLCSPAYGAPEQFNPTFGRVGPATDVYGLAMVLLEALAGRRVREVRSMVDGAQLACDPSAVPRASALGVSVSPELEALLVRCLAVDPSARPQDVGEFWRDFTKLAHRHSAREPERTELSPLRGGASPDDRASLPPTDPRPDLAMVPPVRAGGVSPVASTLAGDVESPVAPAHGLGGTVIMPDRPLSMLAVPAVPKTAPMAAILAAPTAGTVAMPSAPARPLSPPAQGSMSPNQGFGVASAPPHIATPVPIRASHRPATPGTGSGAAPAMTARQPSRSQQVLVAGIAFLVTLLVLAAGGYGAYQVWLSHSAAQPGPGKK